jgi:hypothetical protein
MHIINKKIISAKDTQQVKSLAKKLYRGNISHARHDKAIQFIDNLTDHESKPFYDALRGELNSMVSADFMHITNKTIIAALHKILAGRSRNFRKT